MEESILVVDDEERMRKLIKDFLTNKGYHILEAEDGEKALEIYQENKSKIMLVLLDVMMPKLDGWSVLRQIRQENKELPIIMLTARGEEQDELFGFELGVDEYISKPFSPKILVARVEAILKRTGKIFCLFLLIVVLVNVLSPLFCRKPDETYVESLRKTEFTSETAGVERICCIDDNEEALLWRLRMIGTAKESIVLSTFDLRADDNGTKILAALNCAAARGVKIQLLIDGIYQQLFLAGSSDFQALASYENVEVGVYNPVTPVNLFKVNYRMHDKYLIVDAGRTQQQ